MADRLISVPAARAHIEVAVGDELLKGCMNNVLDSLPAVDAVEVVRCKECKNSGQCSIQDAMNWTPRTEIGDYFCSYGERRCNNV